MHSKFMIAAAVTTATMMASAMPAAAAGFFATSVVEADAAADVNGSGLGPGPGFGDPARNNDDPTAMLGAPDNVGGALDGTFYSLGLGGFAVVEFGQLFNAPSSTGDVFEVTTICDGPGAGACTNFPEFVEVFAGSGYTAGDGFSFIDSNFTSWGELGNADAQNDIGVTIIGPFTQIALVDRTDTAARVGNSSVTSGTADGFDVDAIKVTPVPVPAALPLLAGGLGLLALVRRRRAVA